MASPAAGEPSPPPPPGGWLSGLVSGAGRILAGFAAVLGPESSSDATSSSPESSQSSLPPPARRARSAADQSNEDYFAYDNYQFNKSGKEIVLKDYDKGSRQLVSHIDRKDALAELIMQETFSRSEYVTLKKMIQERIEDPDPVIDEPDVALPISWLPSTHQRPLALSPQNPPPQTSGVPAYRPLFGNTSGKRRLRKGSTTLEDPCTLKNLSHHQRRHVVKRSYSNTVDTFEEPRRVRSKLNRLNTPEKVFDALSNNGAFEDPVTNDAGELIFGELRGFLEELKNIPLLGTDNLTFSNIASKVETARPVRHLATTSGHADVNKHGSAMFYPYSHRDLTETFPVKVESFDVVASLQPAMMHTEQKNHERSMSNVPCPDSKVIFQNIEAAPSSSNGLQLGNSSRNRKKGFNMQGSIPTKARSPANSSHPPSNRRSRAAWRRLDRNPNLVTFRRRGRSEGQGKQ